MEALYLFWAKSILVSGLLTLLYFTCLRGKRLHQYNRFFLLSLFPLSLLIPLLRFDLFPVPAVLRDHLSPVSLILPPPAGGVAQQSVMPSALQVAFPWQAIPVGCALLVSLALLLILGLKIHKVRLMCRREPVQRWEGIDLVLTDMPGAPFAFFRTLFWNKDIPLDTSTGRLIFRHERAHIEQGHTYDKLFAQVLTCAFWFNPFYWMAQRELAMVHEFIADEQWLEQRDTEAFALMLLQSYHKGNLLVPEHHFFSSSVKRRLGMLQVLTMPSHALLRKCLVLPVTAGIILLCSFGQRGGRGLSATSAPNKIVVLLDIGVGAGYQENAASQLIGETARRLNVLSRAYNVEFQLLSGLPVSAEGKLKADLFMAIRMDKGLIKDPEKGHFDIYVSGDDAHAQESNIYGAHVLDALALKGIIPGRKKTCAHVGVPCHCKVSATSLHDGISTVGEDRFLRFQESMPAMMMVLGPEDAGADLRQSQADRIGLLCNALLEGIVRAAAEQGQLARSGMGQLSSGAYSMLPVFQTAVTCN